MPSGPFAAVKLEFLRQRLNARADDRLRRPTTERTDYGDLCARELSILANAPLPKHRTRRRR